MSAIHQQMLLALLCAPEVGVSLGLLVGGVLGFVVRIDRPGEGLRWHERCLKCGSLQHSWVECGEERTATSRVASS